MVGYYSSYLEFIGAVYFSMSLDEILKKKVWNPQDAKKQSRVLSSLVDSKDKNFAKAVVDANQAKGSKLQAELSKKSITGLFLVAFLLLFCGYEASFEPTLPEHTYKLSQWHLSLAYTLVAFIILLYIFRDVIFEKWKYTASFIIAILFIPFILYHANLVYGHTLIERWVVENIGLFVCAIISIPIIGQIFITWIYKSVFYGFIKDKIGVARDAYLHIIEDIQKGNYEKIPREYHEIYLKNSQKNPEITAKQALDDSLTEYQGLLYNEIRTIGNNVKTRDLFKSWVLYKLNSATNSVRNLFRRRSRNRIQVKDYSYYVQKFECQKKNNKSLKMRSFCQEQNISFDEFKSYYSSHCQNFKKK